MSIDNGNAAPLTIFIRLIVAIIALASAWLAFAMPLLWWGIVGFLFCSLGLISFRNYLRKSE